MKERISGDHNQDDKNGHEKIGDIKKEVKEGQRIERWRDRSEWRKGGVIRGRAEERRRENEAVMEGDDDKI